MPNLRGISAFIIGSFFISILFFWPHSVMAQTNKEGSLVGYIYKEDCTTPVEGAVIRMRNISGGSEYESKESNKLGAVAINSIEEGLYTVGIFTEDGGFNIENIIGIKANELAEVSFTLRPLAQETPPAKKDKKRPRGKWYYPEVIGQCDPGYRWNPKTLRCEWGKKGIGSFLASPLGIATVLGATVSGAYGVIKLTEKEEEVSPFR
jgi:hypothetical protein